MKPRYPTIAIAAFIFFVVSACAPIVYTPKAPLDTPARHVENGIRLLNLGKTEDAFREFNRAKALDPAYAPAYVGIGFCYGLMGNYEKGLKAMEEARSLPTP